MRDLSGGGLRSAHPGRRSARTRGPQAPSAWLWPAKPSTNWAIDPGEGPFYQIAPRRVLAYAEASFPDSAADCRIHPVVILSAMSTDTPMPLQLSSSWTWKPADP